MIAKKRPPARGSPGLNEGFDSIRFEIGGGFHEIRPKIVIFFIRHVFPHISALTASISNRVAPKFQLSHGLPRGDGRLGQFDRFDGENHEHRPLLEEKHPPCRKKRVLSNTVVV